MHEKVKENDIIFVWVEKPNVLHTKYFVNEEALKKYLSIYWKELQPIDIEKSYIFEKIKRVDELMGFIFSQRSERQ